MEKKMNVKRKHRKIRHSSTNQSVIDVIADTDGNDFDNPETTVNDSSFCERQKELFAQYASKTSPKILTGSTSNRNSLDKSTELVKQHIVGTPPPLDEVHKIIQGIANEESLDLDLESIIKEWNKENESGKFIQIQQADSGVDISMENIECSMMEKMNMSQVENCIEEQLQESDSTGDRQIDSTDKLKTASNIETKLECIRNSDSDMKTEKYLNQSSLYSTFNTSLHKQEHATPTKVSDDQLADDMSVTSGDSPVFHKSQVKTPISILSKVNHDSPESSLDAWPSESMDESLLFRAVRSQQEEKNHNSQVTFTQAFACIQGSSVECSEEGGTQDSNSLTKDVETTSSNSKPIDKQNIDECMASSITGSKYPNKIDVSKSENIKGSHSKNQTSEVTSCKKVDSTDNETEQIDAKKIPPQINCSDRRPSSSSEDGVEFPDFDLGFDVDDDIIPPSPDLHRPCVKTFVGLSQTSKTLSNAANNYADQSTVTEDQVQEDRQEIVKTPKGRKNLFRSSRGGKSHSLSLNQLGNQDSKIDTDNDLSHNSKSSDNACGVTEEGDNCLSRTYQEAVKSPVEGRQGRFSVSFHLEEEDQSQAASGGFQCNSPQFETSFALLDEEFDDWIDSGTKPAAKTVEDNHPTVIQSDQEGGNTVKTHEVSGGSKQEGEGESFNDQESEWFDDSFNCPNTVTPAVKSSRLSSGDWMTSRHSTSTPVLKSCLKVQTVTPLRSFALTPKTIEKSENDDSFIVKRKKKIKIIDSSDSEAEQLAGNTTTLDRSSACSLKKQKMTDFKLLSSDEDDFDDSFMLTKNKYYAKKPAQVEVSEVHDSSSDDDFEGDFLNRTDRKANGKPKVSATVSHAAKVKPSKTKRSSNPFIEEEAEVSDEDYDDASSDEAEESDQDHYEDSFIHDTQGGQSQVQNQSDMQAMYLKSVKSPMGHRGRFKLQFNARDVSVYSQAPSQHESQYMEDSFCVGSEESEEEDEFDWLSLSKNESEGEVTMLNASTLHGGRPRRRNVKNFETSRQRAIHAGRMKALDKIKAKASRKMTNITNDKKPEATSHRGKAPAPKKTRIRSLDESSSEEEQNGRLQQSMFISPDMKFSERKTKKRPRLLSSSDDDILEANNKSLSLKDRIKINSAKRKRVHEQADKSSSSESKFMGADVDFEKENMDMTRIKPKLVNTGRDNTKYSGKSMSCDKRESLLENDTDIISAPRSGSSISSGKSIIFVDSKELSGAQNIISDLRFKHNIHVSTASLADCDYIVSNRMAVERKQWSEFSNGANRSKIVDRLQQLQNSYDRHCLIIENDHVKPGEEKAQKMNWTKYVQKTLALVLKSPIKVLFSKDQNETAALLSDLCDLEQRKNMGITGKVDMSAEKMNVVKFYSSFPNVTYVNAFNLCNGFASINQFMSSSVSMIEEKGKMSSARATELWNFIRRDFDPQMLPTSYK